MESLPYFIHYGPVASEAYHVGMFYVEVDYLNNTTKISTTCQGPSSDHYGCAICDDYFVGYHYSKPVITLSFAAKPGTLTIERLSKLILFI